MLRISWSFSSSAESVQHAHCALTRVLLPLIFKSIYLQKTTFDTKGTSRWDTRRVFLREFCIFLFLFLKMSLRLIASNSADKRRRLNDLLSRQSSAALNGSDSRLLCIVLQVVVATGQRRMWRSSTCSCSSGLHIQVRQPSAGCVQRRSAESETTNTLVIHSNPTMSLWCTWKQTAVLLFCVQFLQLTLLCIFKYITSVLSVSGKQQTQQWNLSVGTEFEWLSIIQSLIKLNLRLVIQTHWNEPRGLDSSRHLQLYFVYWCPVNTLYTITSESWWKCFILHTKVGFCSSVTLTGKAQQ